MTFFPPFLPKRLQILLTLGSNKGGDFITKFAIHSPLSHSLVQYRHLTANGRDQFATTHLTRRTSAIHSAILFQNSNSRSSQKRCTTHAMAQPHDCDRLVVVLFWPDSLAPGILECSKLSNGKRLGSEKANGVNHHLQIIVTWRHYTVNLDRKKSDVLFDVCTRLALRLQKFQGREISGNGIKKKSNHLAKKQKKFGGKEAMGHNKDHETSVTPSTLSSENTPTATLLETLKINSANEISLIDPNGNEIDKQLLCYEAFHKAKFLKIKDDLLSIIWNSPKITRIGISGKAVVGLPCVISFEREPISCPRHEFQIEWCIERDSGKDLSCSPIACGNSIIKNLEHFKVVRKGMWFVPQLDHVGKKLLVRGFHASLPCSDFRIETPAVESPRTYCWRDERLKNFARMNETTEAPIEHPIRQIIRFATFNILAEDYSRTPYAREICFPYCSDAVISFSSRAPRIASEILQLDCDIICLQECTLSFFRHTLLPLLDDKYGSRLTLKKSAVKEGEAILYNRSKFQELCHDDFDFKTTLVTDPSFSSLVEAIKIKWPHFLDDVLPHLTTIFQLTVLQCRQQPEKDHKLVIVGNSHFFFHPMAAHIRLLQGYVMLHRIALLKQKLMPYAKEENIGIILTGDFNAPLESGTYTFLAKGSVTCLHPDWSNGTQFTWSMAGNDQEEIAAAAAAAAAANPTQTDSQIISDMQICDKASLNAHCPESITSGSLEAQVQQTSQLKVASAESLLRMTPTEFNSNNTMMIDSDGLGVNLTSPHTLGSLRDVYDITVNPFTNLINGFFGTLDHIFISEATLTMKRVLDPVPLESGRRLGGLPSIEYPSDHIAIAAEIEF